MFAWSDALFSLNSPFIFFFSFTAFSVAASTTNLWKVVSFRMFVDVPRFHGGEKDSSGGAAKNLTDEQCSIV